MSTYRKIERRDISHEKKKLFQEAIQARLDLLISVKRKLLDMLVVQWLETPNERSAGRIQNPVKFPALPKTVFSDDTFNVTAKIW